MRTSQTKKSNLIKTSATFLVAFLFLALFSAASNTFAIECSDGVTSSGVCGTDTADVHVSVEGGWAISVFSAGTLGVDVSPTNSGVLSTVVDNVNVYTNIPTGYQLYLNSTSGSTDIYNDDLLDDSGNLSANLPAGTNTNHFSATTGTKDNPIALSNNTWGYSLDNSPTTFTKVPLTNDDIDSNIYTNPTKTSSSGDNIPVSYGFMADTKLSPGTYSTSVTYTAIADAPTYAIASVSPNSLLSDDQTDKTVTIMTSTPTSELAFGNISARITDGTNTVNLTDCTEITSDGYRGVECVYNGNLDYGTYNVELTSSWHNATYILTDGFNIGGKTIYDITAMQEMTSDICSMATSGAYVSLQDTRDGQSYRVTKLPDGFCWTTQNMKYNTSGSLANKSGYDGRLYNYEQANNTCPSGWILPNGSGERSYENLFSGRVTSYTGAEAAPYYFTRAGCFNNFNSQKYEYQGYSGGYWTSEDAGNGTSAYFFYYRDTLFDPKRGHSKAVYDSVRCVFGS